MCGACCRRPGLLIFGDDEVRAIAKHEGVSIYDLILRCNLEVTDGEWRIELVEQPCPFLVDDRCSIQDVKPRQCRSYPFWPEIVEDDATWDAEREHCPGIGEGFEWQSADIAAMLELAD